LMSEVIGLLDILDEKPTILTDEEEEKTAT